MTQPQTGVKWDEGGFNDVDSRFLDRGGKIAVLVRDDRGAATDMSPVNANGTVKWSPCAVDGTWRDDLLAWRRVNGIWTKVTTPNEGFHLVGAFKEGDGPKKNARMDSDDFMIEQENMPFDSDIVKEDEPFSFTGVESLSPWMLRLRNNLRLNDPDTGESLAEDPGADGFVASKPIGADNVDRQVLLMRERRVGGFSRRICTGYALGKLNDIGGSQMGKRDADAPELTYKPLPNPFFMDLVDGEYRPVLRAMWIDGKAWRTLRVAGPAFGPDAPVATDSGTAGKATVAFDTPTGGTTPYTYTVETKIGPGSWTAATLDGSPNNSGGTTTLTVKNLTSGSAKFRVKVTDNNSVSTVSAESNTITVT